VLALPRLLEVGSSLGRYRIRQFLGSGGYGDVYLAFDTVLKREVALKLPRGRGEDQAGQLTRRTMREARAAAGTRHANTVVIYDVGEIEGQPFIAMEVVEGETLRDLVERRDAPLSRRVRWIRDLAAALAAAHKAGFVHRDVKPGNVKVQEDDTLKLLDFGVAAQTLDRDEPPWSVATQDGFAPGTPLYMAPEALAGAPPTPASDQYAWGLVAYEVLSGQHPRKPSGRLRVWDAYANPPPLERVVPEVPPAVSRIVAKSLSLSLGDRFESMAAVVDALSEPGLEDSGTVTMPTPRPSDAVSTRDEHSSDKYSREEMERILERAIERSATAPPRDIDHATVVEAAGEVGVPKEAVDAAASELRAERVNRRRWAAIGLGTAVVAGLAVAALAWPGSAAPTFNVWRQTGQCSALGPRQPPNDKGGSTLIISGWSGLCECGGGVTVGGDCGHAAATCDAVCKAHGWPVLSPGAACVGWRQTRGCVAGGPRESQNDKTCDAVIATGASGFCECAGGAVVAVDCGHAQGTCERACRTSAWERR